MSFTFSWVMPGSCSLVAKLLLNGVLKSSLYSEYTIFEFLKQGSSANAVFMYRGVRADIHPWQWIMSGIHLSFLMVSSTPLR